ncbi:MAG TPA: GTP cyclohydrolase II [Actinomycetota bacterium]|nr:GTP cyclohydrolase II [Actinomycetota bacterium]
MGPTEVARTRLPTAFGAFELRAFKTASGFVHLALVAGDVGDGTPVLTRVHSECLTGDALGSLRCDCGVQLAAALKAIGAEGRGVLVYVTGHEGRGIGLVDKLRAYFEQDRGADTVDANLHLGLPVDGRDYGDAADVLKQLGVRSVRLITNNPRKVSGLRDAGVEVESVRGLAVAANGHTVRYLSTKRDRLGHGNPLGAPLVEVQSAAPDVSSLLGAPRPHDDRPYVVVKYAQSMDGRIATATGDSRWISSEEERAVSHALRARCDGIMVGVGTVLSDDPQLTVRLVPGPSPTRVVLDSTLRSPPPSRVFDGTAPTVVATTEGSDERRRADLRARDVAVRVVDAAPDGVDVRAALAMLRRAGLSSLLVEGGQRVITSLLRARCVDRVVVALAPIVLGKGVEGVGDLGIGRVADGISLTNRSVSIAGTDVLVACDVTGNGASTAAPGDAGERAGGARPG